jgi:hypothetical protein
LVFPIYLPELLARGVNSPIGSIFIFCVAVYLFLYSTPIIALLFVLVGYVLILRSSEIKPHVAYVQYTDSQEKRDSVMEKMNEPMHERTLEEDVVQQMAPIGKSSQLPYVESEFKPVADNVDGASMI